MFTVAESVTVAKTGDPALNEDVVADGPHWLAVCDGATDKSGYRRDGETGGRVAARVIAAAVAALPPGTSPADLVAAANTAYLQAFGTDLDRLGPDRPECSFVAVDKASGTVVRVGDVSWRTATELHLGRNAVDDLHAGLRAEHLRGLLAEGATTEELLATDPGRALILPRLRAQAGLRNDPGDGDLAYGAIDGRPVPERHVETWTTAGPEVVVATDGYPVVLLTLVATEAALAADLVADPLRIGAHPGTKGVRPGDVSFDDRSYVRLILV
ncbi:hypothetical protein [Marmoricola sp. RAF53]|uniref:hypothetical protein n=1 Tax=Marmoricola sp. RAF53 TaxID=3233059 RepID=UPI003F9B8D26